MKKFISKVLIFSLTTFIVAIVFNLSYDLLFNQIESKDSIFIFGDSQTKRGLNKNLIIKNTNRKVFSCADEGFGVYDFLVFSNKISPNSKIILGLSKPMFFRDYNHDYNNTGFSINAFKTLYCNDYPKHIIKEILIKNLKPKPTFNNKISSNLFPLEDSVIFDLNTIDLLKKAFKSSKKRTEIKRKCFLRGLDILINKSCIICVIEFPVHKGFDNIQNKHISNHFFDTFKSEIISKLEIEKIDSIKINKRIMYDLTHLNKFGANIISEKISRKMEESKFITINNGIGK